MHRLIPIVIAGREGAKFKCFQNENHFSAENARDERLRHSNRVISPQQFKASLLGKELLDETVRA